MTTKDLSKLLLNIKCDSWNGVTTEDSVTIKWNDYVDEEFEKLSAKRFNGFIGKNVKNTVPTNNNETKKENIMNDLKNVLFLAPGYNYAKSVISNQSKELDRKKIPYNASTDPLNLYISTDKVRIQIVYIDPVKWTPDLFKKRDAVFGKKELLDKAQETFYSYVIRRPNVSLSKYIRDVHADPIDPTVADTKPRETYIPEIKNAYFNDPMTIVIWKDGTKTMIRCQEGDVYSAETGLALCIAKKALGNMPNFNNVFKKWIPEKKENNDE